MANLPTNISSTPGQPDIYQHEYWHDILHDFKNRILTPEMFGSTGGSDDTEVVQAMFDAANNTNIVELTKLYNVGDITITGGIKHIRARGFESTGLKAISGTTTLLSVDQSTLRTGFTMDDVYLDCTASTSTKPLYLNNIQYSTFRNVRVREGTIGFHIDAVSATDFVNCHAVNNRTNGFLVDDTTAIDNIFSRCKVVMTSSAAADMTSAGFKVQHGASTYLLGTRILRSTAISFYMPYGIEINSDATTDWVFLNNVVTDGITDGTGALSANSASLYLKTAAGVFVTNSFFSANTSSPQRQYAIRIDGGSDMHFKGSRISGGGVEFLNTPDQIEFDGCDWPQAYGDAAFTFTSTPTNLDVKNPQYNGYKRASSESAYKTATNALTIAASTAIAENVDRAVIGNNSSLTLTSGTLYLWAIDLPAGITVTSLTFYSGNTALANGGGSPHAWAALYTASKVLLAQSTDNTALSWGNNQTAATFTLSAAQTITQGGRYLVGLMVNSGGGTQPTMSTVVGLAGMNGITPVRAATADTSLVGTAPNPAGATANISQTPYIVVA